MPHPELTTKLFKIWFEQNYQNYIYFRSLVLDKLLGEAAEYFQSPELFFDPQHWARELSLALAQEKNLSIFEPKGENLAPSETKENATAVELTLADGSISFLMVNGQPKIQNFSYGVVIEVNYASIPDPIHAIKLTEEYFKSLEILASGFNGFRKITMNTYAHRQRSAHFIFTNEVEAQHFAEGVEMPKFKLRVEEISIYSFQDPEIREFIRKIRELD